MALLLAIPVVAGEITITKNLSTLVPGEEVRYNTRFSVWDSNPATWEILYSNVNVVNGFVSVSVYTVYLSNYLFSLEFKDNNQLVLSYTTSSIYKEVVIGNITDGNKIIITYNADSLKIEQYNNTNLVNSLTITDIAVQTEIQDLGISLIATNNPSSASGSITIYITYGTSTSSSTSETNTTQAVQEVSKTIQDTAVKTVPPLMGLGVLLLGLKKIEEILSSLMR